MTSPDPTLDNVTNTDPLYMGKAVWTGEQSLIGRIDEVLIYNTALTPTQVTPMTAPWVGDSFALDIQVAAVYTACLPSSVDPLECPQCPLNTTEPWPLMENFQTGGHDPIGCRECCATKCDDLCFDKGSNPGRCMGSSPLEAYMRCMGTGYVQANCTGNSTQAGCLFSGAVRRCPADCALQGSVAAHAYG